MAVATRVAAMMGAMMGVVIVLVRASGFALGGHAWKRCFFGAHDLVVYSLSAVGEWISGWI